MGMGTMKGEGQCELFFARPRGRLCRHSDELLGEITQEFFMVFCVSYDLNRPGQSYATLFAAIKSLGDYWHYLDSTWLVESPLSAIQISEHLRKHIDSNDNLLVIGVRREYAGWLSKEAWQWIETHRLAA